MTTEQMEDHKRASRKNTRTLAWAIGIPLCGLIITCIWGGGGVVNQVHSLIDVVKENKVDANQRMDKIDSKIDRVMENQDNLNKKVDRIFLHQHDDSILNVRRYNYVQTPRYRNYQLSTEHKATPTSSPTFIPYVHNK